MNYTKMKVDMLYSSLQQDQYIREKYDNKIGLYSIKIEDKLVYIGKSTNILYRIANHLFLTENLQYTNSHKYKIFNQAIQQGMNIYFDVIQLCNDEEELGNEEGKQIRFWQPILNYQIPKEENYHSYTVNRKAKYISLDEILRDGQVCSIF